MGHRGDCASRALKFCRIPEFRLAALAASWGFMLPAGTGPNAIAWATGRIRIERMVGAGLVLDLIGIFLIVGVVWVVATLV